MMTDLRKDCPMRHENGNCAVIGGFCTAVNDPICEGLHSAYDSGYRAAALRAQQEREHPMTNGDRIRAMSDEEMAKKLGRGLGCPVTAYCMKMSGDCKACWLDWLQQPAEEG